jgi:hypothetical protein
VARLCSTAAFLCAICVSTAQAEGRSDLDGVWLYVDSETPAELNLTPAGLAKMQAYVPLTDDSDNYCIPASFTNIMHTPSPPFEIRLRADAVEIDYEFLDVRRRIPLRLPGDPAFALDDAPHSVPAYPHLGRSLARFDGETLVVETADVGDGYLDLHHPGQLAVLRRGQSRVLGHQGFGPFFGFDQHRLVTDKVAQFQVGQAALAQA